MSHRSVHRHPSIAALGGLVFAVVLVALHGCSSIAPDDRQPGRQSPEQLRLLEHASVLAADSFLGRKAGSPDERLAAEYIGGVFADLGLAPGAPDYLQTFTIPGPAESQNVIGELPGAGALADEWVILGGHYDHLGFDELGEIVWVYNGADDNASGIAVVLESARILSELASAEPERDRRSVMFHAYGAEEAGLLGSRYFADHPTVPLVDVVAMVNLDMVGRLRGSTLIVQGYTLSPIWADLVADANDGTLVIYANDGAINRSDHYPFLLQGVPALHLFTGVHPDYHSYLDDVEYLNLEGLEAVADFAVSLLWELATRTELTPVP